MRRRRWLQWGALGTVVVVTAGIGIALTTPKGLAQGRLSAPAREVLAAVARAVLDGRLPAATNERAAALQAHLQRFESTVAAFPRGVQDEIGELLMLLGTTPGRFGLAGLREDWSTASTSAIQQALQGMRESTLTPRVQAYHALRDLTHAAHYADAAHWTELGYPGPRAL